MRALGFLASRSFIALSTLLFPQTLAAQEEWLPAPGVNLSRTAGLHLLDGVLHGVGDGYRARFDVDGFVFMPVLEPAAADAYTMTFRLESFGRDGHATTPTVGGAAPAFDGLRVEYDRGGAIERYDIGVDGVEQSFVFHERPPGTGDLVVRGALRTELQVTPEGAGLRLELPGVGSFTIGGVVGIDAAGEHCAGDVRFVDGAVELSLPGAFVERAALPLTLDPFIGNVIRVATTALDFRPRVSFDATTNNYLVVWQSSNAVHAHRVSRTGTLVGTRLVIETIGRVPEVANVNDRDAFVVVYERNGDIFGRIVNAASAVSTETTIAGTADPELTPTVGGTLGFSASNPGVAVCAWVSSRQGSVSIKTTALNIDPTRRPVITVGPVQTPAQGFTSLPAAPRLSRSDGGVERWALAFHRDESVDSVRALVLDRTGRAITPEVQLIDSPLRDQQFADVDGDGSNWVVAWTERTAASTLQVAARGVAWAASQQILVRVGTGVGTGLENTGPSASVAWIGQSHLLGAVSATRVEVRSIDPFLCGACEGTLPITGVGTAGSTPFGCGTIAGGGPADDALVAGSDASGVFARPFRATDGVVTSLGGGCGAGGTALVACARSPNARFAHQLRNSIPNSPCAFVLSGSLNPFSCGTCTLMPDLASAIVLTISVGSAGEASVPFAIPANSSLRGVPLFEQWATLNLQTPACGLFSLDFSDALRVVIE